MVPFCTLEYYIALTMMIRLVFMDIEKRQDTDEQV